MCRWQSKKVEGMRLKVQLYRVAFRSSPCFAPGLKLVVQQLRAMLKICSMSSRERVLLCLRSLSWRPTAPPVERGDGKRARAARHCFARRRRQRLSSLDLASGGAPARPTDLRGARDAREGAAAAVAALRVVPVRQAAELAHVAGRVPVVAVPRLRVELALGRCS